MQAIKCCCKLSKSVKMLSILKIYVFFMSCHLLDMNSASSNPKSCPLWPKRSPPPSSTSTQPLKLANSWSKLSTPSLVPSLRSRDGSPKRLILAFSKSPLQIFPNSLFSSSNFKLLLHGFAYLLMSSVWHLFRTPSKRHSQ